MKPRSTLPTLLLATLACASWRSGQAATNAPSPFQTTLRLKPALLHATRADKVAPALRYDAGLRYDYAPWTSRLTGFAAVQSQGTLATDRRAHSENIFAELRAGLFYDFYEPPRVTPPPPPGERSPILIPPPPTGGYDHGRIEFAPHVRIETDQPLENYHLAYGFRLGYGNLSQTGPWALVPSVHTEFQRVDVLHSEQFRALGVAEDAFFRFGLIASWDWAIGEDLAPHSRFWQPFGLHFDVRYHRAYALPAGGNRPDLRESLYVAGGVNYELTGRLKWVRSVHVTVAQGRLPPAPRDETMIYVGVVLGTRALPRRN